MKTGVRLSVQKWALAAGGLIVLWGAVWFRIGIHRAAVWESELATVAHAGPSLSEAPGLPHLEYRAPAFHSALKALGAGGARVMRARHVSWLAAVGATAALVAAGWTLFSPLDGLVAGALAVGSLRFLQAAQSAIPLSFLMFWLALTTALFGAAMRSSSWGLWIALGLSGVVSAMAGFQALPLLLALAAVGAALVSQRTRRDGTEVEPPLWQYLSCVPPALVVAASSAVAWVVASRAANPPLGKPPLMNLRYAEFLVSFLFGHGTWGPRLLGFAATVGLVSGVRKRIIRVEDLGRVYVDKRSRRPMVVLALWLVVGVPMINLMLFNARRPQDPAVLESLFIPLSLMAAHGVVVGGEWLCTLLRRVVGLRVPSAAVVVALGVLLGWFGQGTSRRFYLGYRTAPTREDPWAEAASYLAPRSLLGRSAVLAPPWAAGLIHAHVGPSMPGVEMVVPRLGAQVDSLVRATPASWAILYQSELYAFLPERLRASIERNYEELKRFPTPWGGVIAIRATPWLRTAEAQWSVEQERLAMGGRDADEARLSLARIYLDAGRVDSAKAALQVVLAHDPTDVRAMLQMAVLAERDRDGEEAASWYLRACNAAPLDPRPPYELGRLAKQEGNLEEARVQLERALRVDPRHVQAAQLLARVYREMGRVEEANALDAKLREMGGTVFLDYEYGRMILVRSVDLPRTPWRPGETQFLTVSWVTTSSSRTAVIPVLAVSSEASAPSLRPPAGGWRLSLPDTGFAAGISGVDTLPVHFAYREPPRRYPDEIEVGLRLMDAKGTPLDVSSVRGGQVPSPSIARIVAWRASAEQRFTVEAEEMEQHPGFPMPGGINVAEPGLAHRFRFPGGPVTLEVVARGTPAAGQWPRMIVEVGGVVVRELEVPDREWRTYTISVTAPPGLRMVRLRFPNDYVNPATGEDRNLVIDKVTVVEEEIQLRFEPP